MSRPVQRPVTPDQRLRDLRAAFRNFEKEPADRERAVRLAAFARAAHDERQLNMAMHAAELCLQDAPEDGTELLLEAYAGPPDDVEEQLRSLADLDDLARYVGRPDLADEARSRLAARARDWVAAGDPAERRHRLRTVQSAGSRELADDIRDGLEGTS
jgi:hypothetical protein